MKGGQTVLVTAAAGGTGQFVVQLAKAAGNAVVATCGGDDKAALLKRLGADRVVNYRRESLKDVLRAEYPKVRTYTQSAPVVGPGERLRTGRIWQSLALSIGCNRCSSCVRTSSSKVECLQRAMPADITSFSCRRSAWEPGPRVVGSAV